MLIKDPEKKEALNIINNFYFPALTEVRKWIWNIYLHFSLLASGIIGVTLPILDHNSQLVQNKNFLIISMISFLAVVVFMLYRVSTEVAHDWNTLSEDHKKWINYVKNPNGTKLPISNDNTTKLNRTLNISFVLFTGGLIFLILSMVDLSMLWFEIATRFENY